MCRAGGEGALGLNLEEILFLNFYKVIWAYLVTYAGNKISNAPKKIFHIYVKASSRRGHLKNIWEGKRLELWKSMEKKMCFKEGVVNQQ